MRGNHGALGNVEATSPTHEVGDNDRKDRAVDTRPDPLSVLAPTSIATGTITICAATMHADIRVVPSFLSCKASFWPTNGSIAALAR